MGLPVEVNNLMMGSLGGYNINRSLRFRSSASAYLSRTPSVAGNRQKYTWSAWVKRGSLASNTGLFSALSTLSPNLGYNTTSFKFNSADNLRFESSGPTGGALVTFSTTAVFRDPSAWYHIVFALDTTQATNTNGLKIYVNGVLQAGTFSAYVQNTNTFINTTTNQQEVGRATDSSGGSPLYYYFDGYMAEVNFIDGQQLTPSSFGAYDTNGVWQPKKYTGTYGTNGFYLPFLNTTSTTTLVQDYSGNGNNWTPNNISLTAGTTYDSMIDSPTVSASASNYCVFNPVNVSGGGSTITDGNLSTSAGSTGTYGKILGSIGMSSGKWYWEVTITAVGSLALVGIGDGTPPNGSTGLGGAAGELAYFSNGNKYTNAVSTAYGATYTTNDVIGVAYDASAGTLTFYKNNSSQGAITGFSGTKYAAVGSGGGTNPQYAINFGQRPFSYTPPTGFNALNTYNLPAPSIANGAQYMNAVLWSGNSTANRNITGVGFAPDFVWLKCRNSTQHHHFVDSVRGTGTSVMKTVFSSLTNAEETDRSASILRYGNINALISDGFTVNSGTDATYPYDQVNANGLTYVAWNWKANGSGVTNTSGTITSTVSANPTAGFSIVTFSGIGANATVGHGLNSAPSMIIAKVRNGTGGWPIYHANLASPAYFLELQSTNGQVSSPTVWNSTAPTSSVFSIGSAFNNVSNYVAYCFSAVSGYSSFGVYTGNGSSTDGPFIYTGFRPRFLMIKRIDAADDWPLEDTSRNTYNLNTQYLLANSFAAEGTVNLRDFLSNGFKVRAAAQNTNGATYVYAAFSEHPFKYSRAR